MTTEMHRCDEIRKITELLDRRKLVWGIGESGEALYRLLTERAKEPIAFFVDSKLLGSEGCRFHDIPAFGPDALDRLYDPESCVILVASALFREEIKAVLSQRGLKEQTHFVDATESAFHTAFCEWTLRRYLRTAENRHPAFPELIELETINRCNGSCAFCPVNRHDDPRELALMDEALFCRIVEQIGASGFKGRMALFSNNEPFLDKRIVKRLRFVRDALPAAHLYLFTNGSLLTLEKFIEIMEYLDELIIDNYSDALRLHPNTAEIHEYVSGNRALQHKVHIYLRRENEVLTTRGGQAPNQRNYDAPEFLSCVLPFKQMIIRPDGKVSLCCNDALGKYTLGDLKKERVSDVWNGRAYREIRKRILKSRKGLALCEHCDNVFDYHIKPSGTTWFSGGLPFGNAYAKESLHV